jgi:hypothetical protein
MKTTTMTQTDIFNQVADIARPKKKLNPPSYFNTVNLEGNDLEREQANCRGQEAEVIKIFKMYVRDTEMSPEFVHARYIVEKYGRVPLTSIRRAMTTLTQKGLLIKTDKKVRGSYGKMTYTWKLI